MSQTVDLSPVSGPSAWRGDELSKSTEWIYLLSDAERTELEQAGRKFVADDPDLRTVTAADYPIPACDELNAECARQLDSGRGFILVRGLRTAEYGDTLAAAIFFIMGLHLGQPIGQNNMGHIYENGLGVKADKDEALHWYQLSADQGYELGIDNLTRLQNAGQDAATTDDGVETQTTTSAPKTKSKDKISN